MSEALIWKPFSLGNKDIFSLESTSTGIDKIKLELTGECSYPYISRSDKFNGINSLIPRQPKEPNKGNVITIGLDTQTVFYQEKDFYTGQNIQILSTKNMSRNIALFLIPLIKKQLKYLSWGGTGATLTRLRGKSILLPTSVDGSPDWDYMNNYIEGRLSQLKPRIPKFKLVTRENTEIDNPEKEWEEFQIKKIFTVETGNYIPSKEMKEGNIPRITAKSVDNGIGMYIENHSKAKVHNNGITASFLGNYFYHPYDFTVDMKIHVLKPLNYELNQFSALFLVTALKKNLGSYSYGNQLSSSDIKGKIIKLPSNESGNPDWEYMEKYMIGIYNKKVKRIKKSNI